MRNKRGQALVEFVLILPIFLLLVFGSIDFGTIIYEKYRLQNDLDVVYELYTNNREQDLNRYLYEHDLKIAYQKNNSYTTITLTKYQTIITPGLSTILKNPYAVVESMTIYDTQS